MNWRPIVLMLAIAVTIALGLLVFAYSVFNANLVWIPGPGVA